MGHLFSYLLIDMLILISVILMMRKQLSFTHPFTMYLFFHLFVITYRAWQIYLGSPPMYAENQQFLTVTSSEIIRALWMADVALFTFGIFSWLGQFRLFASSPNPDNSFRYHKMETGIVRYVCWICLPIGGLFFLLIKLGVPLPDTSYINAIAAWFICSLLMLIYIKGFKLILIFPAGIYLFLVAIQGYHRTQLILPVLFLTCLYLLFKKKNWPNKRLIIAAIIGMLIFPKLKIIGQEINQGNYNQAAMTLIEPFSPSNSEGNEVSTNQFLDQYAASLTMVDNLDKHYYGSTYLAIVTLPIPRILWAGKPGLGDHIIEVATTNRPYDKEGRIITYIGESYFNFGYLGIVLVPAIFAFVLTRWYHQVRKYATDSLSLCIWLIFYCSLIQVFRDGLSSLVTFTVMINMPLFCVALLIYLKAALRK